MLVAAFAATSAPAQVPADPDEYALILDEAQGKLRSGELTSAGCDASGRHSVLVVGHSNTVPGIAAALCQCTVSPMEDTEYDRWIRIQVDANGNATLQETRY